MSLIQVEEIEWYNNEIYNTLKEKSLSSKMIGLGLEK